MKEITTAEWKQAQKHGYAHIRQDGQRTILELDKVAGTVLTPVKVVKKS